MTGPLVVTLRHMFGVVLLTESGVPLAEGICRNNHPHDCVDQNLLGVEDVGVVTHESLVYSEVYLTQGFCSIVGHSKMSCSMELACVMISDVICKSKRNFKPTCGHAKAYGSMIHWHVFLTLQMSVNIKNCIQNSPLKKWPQMIIVFIVVAKYFQGSKMKAFWEEMWLRDFCLRSSKKLDVHQILHVNEMGCNMITLENIDICCVIWYIIHGVFKA